MANIDVSRFTITIGAVSGSNWVTTTTYTDLNLRAYPDYNRATTGITQAGNLGDGVYYFDNVPTGKFYKLFNGGTTTDGTEITKWGVHPLGDPNAVDKNSDQDINGVKNFLDIAQFQSSIKADIFNDVTGGGVDIENVTILDGVVTSDLTVSGALTVGNVTVAGDISCDTGSVITVSQDAVSDNELVRLSQVNNLIAAVAAIPGQRSVKEIDIIATGTVVTGKCYVDCNTALVAISDNAIDKQYTLMLKEGTNVSSVTDEVFYVSHTNLKNYVHFKGRGKGITKLVIGTSGTSVTKTFTVEDCDVYMGVNDISAARTYNGVSWVNVNIYAYNSLTLTSSSPVAKLHGCFIYQPTGKTFTVAGATEYVGNNSTQALTSTSTGIVANYADTLNTTYSMPSDLSLAP